MQLNLSVGPVRGMCAYSVFAASAHCVNTNPSASIPGFSAVPISTPCMCYFKKTTATAHKIPAFCYPDPLFHISQTRI